METKNDDKGKWIMDIDEAKKRFKRELLFYKQNIEYSHYKDNSIEKAVWAERHAIASNLYWDVFQENPEIFVELK